MQFRILLFELAEFVIKAIPFGIGNGGVIQYVVLVAVVVDPLAKVLNALLNISR